MSKKAIASIAIIVTLLILAVPIQPVKAQFVIAAYTYPTDNGNGIAYIQAYVDSVYNGTMYYNPDSYPNDTAINPLEVEAEVNITLAVFCWVNGTFTGISSLAEGLNIIRHNVTVTCQNGTTIFSQSNFTYITGSDGSAPMYFYRYDVILDFLPVYDEVYTVTVTYEVYY